MANIVNIISQEQPKLQNIAYIVRRFIASSKGLYLKWIHQFPSEKLLYKIVCKIVSLERSENQLIMRGLIKFDF